LLLEERGLYREPRLLRGVENALLKNAGVAEVSVVPVAMVVKAKGPEISEDELKQFCLVNAIRAGSTSSASCHLMGRRRSTERLLSASCASAAASWARNPC
jgi:hypothetical protein